MSAGVLAAAMVLDAALGEPRWVWDRVKHPVVWLGQAIEWGEARLNTGENRRAKGVALVLALISAAFVAVAVVEILPFTQVLEFLIVAILLSQRSLVDHVGAVARALAGSVSEGRRAVAQIVGRDTSQMEEPDIARAAIESAAENLSDGVVAPALFYLVFGLPGILIYKAINTADSMIGYRNERYEDFGWAAARLDDLLNLLPARLTGMAIALLSGSIGRWPAIVRDARQHRSPNAGWPEAALARALDVALAGPRSYDGEVREFPFVNDFGDKNASASDIRAAVRWLWLTWGGLLVIVLACMFVT